MPDIFDVLSTDHNEVKQMLTQFEKERPGAGAGKGELATRKKKAAKLITEESRHEAAEEMAFWPAVREKLSDGDKLAGQATSQEDEAKKVLAKLGKLDADNPEFEKLLTEFTAAAREHIEFEETQVWPQLRRALSKEEASEIGRKFQEGKKTAGNTRAELYEEARKLGVEGRSSMSKEELARHIAERR